MPLKRSDSMYNKTIKLIKWLSTKIFLHEKFENEPNKFRKYFTPRGSIYTCHFGENIGDEKCGIGRPVLIVSSDSINRNSGNVIVVTLTKNIKYVDGTKKLKYSSHYALFKSRYKKLKFNSCVQCEDIKVISKARLGTLICKVEKNDMKQIKKRLKFILEI